MNKLCFHYGFTLPDGEEIDFFLNIDPDSLSLITVAHSHIPAWARLDFHQCPHCPQSISQTNHCPMALALAPLVEKFSTLLSYEDVSLTVITAQRCIKQQTTAQRGIASLMGLIIATCGCPHCYFLRPMARFHLPLANEEETIYRAFSMYALGQILDNQQGAQTDSSFIGLAHLYAELEKVNSSFVKRLRVASKGDSSINGLVNLDMYAKAMPHVVEDSMDELRYLFTDKLPPSRRNND